MKAVGASLQAHLDGGATTMALCWKLTRTDATVQGFTNHDLDLTFGSVTYKASSGFSATEISNSLGLAVDALDADGALSSAAITEDDLAKGYYDGATVVVTAVNWADVSQRVVVYSGTIGEVSRGKTGFTAELRSLANALGQQTGRAYQYYCDADLGDSQCKIDLNNTAYKGTGTVSAVSGLAMTVTGITSFADAWFTGGKISFTSGANNGLAFEVRGHAKDSTVVLSLWASPPGSVANGDTFSITAGCDKAFGTCKTKFSNAVNYRGFPYIPGNDVVQSYPNKGASGLDGGSLFN